MNTSLISLNRSETNVPRSGRLLLSLFSQIRHGSLDVIVPDGARYRYAGDLAGPEAELHILDWSACLDTFKSGDIGFAEAYLDGRWRTPDLLALLQLAAQNRMVLEKLISGNFWGRMFYRLRHLLRANTRSGARRNIHAHYDLGNEFYAAWLDPSMTYSSAIFVAANQRSLEEAQLAKYIRILDELGVGKGDRLLEIGCGWGGFAEVAARECGAQVHGITLSASQLEFSRRRISKARLEQQVQIELCDYRDVKGEFDFVVSIEMFEAVGEAYWPGYFRTVQQRLRPGGCALIQTILIADELFENYRRGTDFIQQYIFPGGMLPSYSVFTDHAARAGLTIRDSYLFGGDYAKTLSHWRERYNKVAPALRRLGFDERFERMWNFYFAYCEAGFLTGSTDVAQVVLAND